MKRIVSVFLAVALLLTLVPVYAFAEEIVSISYTPKNQITRYFEQGGGVELDNNNHEYYHYNAVQRSSGDIFTVNYSSGKVDYVLEFNPEPVYVSTVDPNDVIDGNEVDMYDQQSVEHFNLGNDNKLYVRYGEKTCYINVNIVINPIKSIVYTPVENIVIYENVDGRWVNDGDTDYFEYNAPPFKEGDTLEITYSNTDDSVVYTYMHRYDQESDSVANGFYDGEGNLLPDGNDLYKSYKGRWSLGSDNYMCVNYMDNESNYVQVNIVENPVKSIVYERVSDVVLVENVDLYYDSYDDRYYYRIPYYQYGDKLIVTDKSDETTVYKYTENDVFASENNGVIDEFDVHIINGQRDNPWQLGENEYCIEYMGARYILYATVKENIVQAIEYKPVKTPSVMEGRDSYYDESEDATVYNFPDFEEGDILVVTYKNDGKVSYIAVKCEYDEIIFRASDGDEISEYDIMHFSDQEENPWTVGGDNEFTLKYMNAACTVKCEVIENPILSIEFIPLNVAKIIENINGGYNEDLDCYMYNYPRVLNGDKLIINYRDVALGRVEYTAEFDNSKKVTMFVPDSGDAIVLDDRFGFGSDQFDNPWTVGENHYFISFLGRVTEVPVIIVENNIKGISFKPASMLQIWEGDYSVDTDPETGKEYNHYNIPHFNTGDTLTVEYNDDTSDDFVLTFEETDGEYYFVCDAMRYNMYDLFVTDNQAQQEWILGRGNYFIVDFYGFTTDVEIEMIKSDVESIVYTPKNEIVIDENTGGELLYDEFNNEFYFYNHVRIVNVGDTLTVNYLGGDSVVYTLQSNDAGDDWILRSADGKILNNEEITVADQQWEKHWKPGENEFIIKYHGASASVKVNIRHTPSDWIIDKKPGLDKAGLKHKECTACGEVLETEIIPVVDPSLPRVEIESLKANAGETVDVKVLVRNNPGINSMKLSISYDTDLTLENVAFSNDIGNLAIASQSLESPMILNFVYGDKNFNTADYTFAVLTFKVSDGASDGLKYVSASYDQENVYNINEYHVKFETVDGGIDVESYLPGDINGDGKVNNKDITRLMQYLSGWSVSVNEPALDVNNDGSVNNKDITRLFKYLSGWDVEIY